MRLDQLHWRHWMFVLSLAALFGACARTDPERALRATVAGLQDAVDTRDASAIEDVLAEDFVGPEGLDRQGAGRMAQLMFLQHMQVGAKFGPLEVTLQDDHATVRFTAVLTGGTGGFLPETGQLYDVQTGWRMQDGDWKLTSAEWSSRL